MTYRINNRIEFFKLHIFSIIKCHIQVYIKDNSIDSKSRTSHPINVWDEINDSRHGIPITNTINIEQYDL
jgi:hypothetical protein